MFSSLLFPLSFTGIHDNQELFSSNYKLYIAAILLQPLGSIIGFIIGLATGMSHQLYRTISLGYGVSSSTVVIAIITLSFKDEYERRIILTYPLMYGLFYILNR